jgi:hypothetical protein
VAEIEAHTCFTTAILLLLFTTALQVGRVSGGWWWRRLRRTPALLLPFGRERHRGSDKGVCGGGLHSHLLYKHVELDGCVENEFTYTNISIYK